MAIIEGALKDWGHIMMLKRLCIYGFIVVFILTPFSIVLSQSATTPITRSSDYVPENKSITEYSQILTSGQQVSPSNPALLEETLELNLSVTTIELSFNLNNNEKFLAFDGASQSFELRVDYEIYFPNGTLATGSPFSTTVESPFHLFIDNPPSGTWRVVVTLVDTGDTTAWIQAISYSQGTKHVTQIEKEQVHLMSGQNLYYVIALDAESDWFFLHITKLAGARVDINLLNINQTKNYGPYVNSRSLLVTSADYPSGMYILKIINYGSTDIFLEIVKPSGVSHSLDLNVGKTLKCQMQYDLEFLKFTVNQIYDWIILDGAVTNDSSSANYMLIDPNLDTIVNYNSANSMYFVGMNPIGAPMLGTYYLAIFGNDYAEATVKVTTFESIPTLTAQKLDQVWKFTQAGQAVYYRIPQSQSYFMFAGITLDDNARAKFSLINPDQSTEWSWGVSTGLAYFPPQKADTPFYVLKLQGQTNCSASIHLRHAGQKDFQISTPDSSKYMLRFSGDLVVSNISIRNSDYLFQHYYYAKNTDTDYVVVGFYDTNLNQLWKKSYTRYNEEGLYHFPEQYPIAPGDYIQIVIGVRVNEELSGSPILQLTTLQTGDESMKFSTPFQTLPSKDTGDGLWKVEVYEVQVLPTHWFEIVTSLYVNDDPINALTPSLKVWAYGPPESQSSNLQGEMYATYPNTNSVKYKLWRDPSPGNWLVVVAGIEYANSDKLNGSVSLMSDIDFGQDWVISELQSGIIVPMFLTAAILVLLVRRVIKRNKSAPN